MINFKNDCEHLRKSIEQLGFLVWALDGEYHSSDDVKVQAIIDNYEPLPAARLAAKKRINDQSQALMSAVEDEYPSFERQTWAKQQSEIESWDIDKTSLTPTLDAIALARSMNRDVLLNKTLLKVNAYNHRALFLIGTRQKLEDDIETSVDLDFINSVNFEA